MILHSFCRSSCWCCCSVKKVFLETLQNSQENTCARVSFNLFNLFLSFRPATLLKMRLWRTCFPVNFAKFLRTPFLTERPRWLLLFLLWTWAYWLVRKKEIVLRGIYFQNNNFGYTSFILAQVATALLLVLYYDLLLINFHWEQRQIKYETLEKTLPQTLLLLFFTCYCLLLYILSLLWGYIFNIGMQLE